MVIGVRLRRVEVDDSYVVGSFEGYEMVATVAAELLGLWSG